MIMEQTIMGKTIFAYELLTACNSNCSHCLREEGNVIKYSESYDSIINMLDRLEMFMQYENIELKLSGGECTIWRDGNKNLSDIICECAKRKIPFAVVTNGILFKKQDAIHELFNSFFYNYEEKLKIYITVDEFHKNFDRKNNASDILDNLSTYMKLNNLEKRFEVYIQSTFTVDENHNLPTEFMRKYYNKNYKFIINPLLPLGKGKTLNKLVPTLDIMTSDKSSLGAYKKYNYFLGKKLELWSNMEEYDSLNNFDVFLKLNNCGQTYMIHNGAVYYCMLHAGNDYFKISDISEFSYELVKKFKDENAIYRMWKNNNASEIREKLISTAYPFCYGVCWLCKEICDNMQLNK